MPGVGEGPGRGRREAGCTTTGCKNARCQIRTYDELRRCAGFPETIVSRPKSDGFGSFPVALRNPMLYPPELRARRGFRGPGGQLGDGWRGERLENASFFYHRRARQGISGGLQRPQQTAALGVVFVPTGSGAGSGTSPTAAVLTASSSPTPAFRGWRWWALPSVSISRASCRARSTTTVEATDSAIPTTSHAPDRHSADDSALQAGDPRPQRAEARAR